jgi:hypothetical protein
MWLKEFLLILIIDPVALINHIDDKESCSSNFTSFLLRDIDRHYAQIRRILYCILNQVDENLLHSRLVNFNN